MHFKSKIFSDCIVDREKSEDHADIYFMTFVLKRKVLKIVKEKVISTCGTCPPPPPHISHTRLHIAHTLKT